MVKRVVCTIVTEDYLDRVLAIGRSLRAAGSPLGVVAAVIGKLDDLQIENVTFFNWRALAAASSQAAACVRAYREDADCLRWSLKPTLLLYMLEVLHHGSALYVDPDFCFFRPPREIFQALQDGGIVLTPHWRPLCPEGSTFQFRLNFLDGLFNAGCVAANWRGREALRWWEAACLSACRNSHADGLYHDQRYLDLMPVYFPQTRILRHQGYNLAEWNIQLRCSDAGGPPAVPDQWPVSLIHFTTATQDLIARGGDPVLQPFLEKYHALLAGAGVTMRQRSQDDRVEAAAVPLRIAHVLPGGSGAAPAMHEAGRYLCLLTRAFAAAVPATAGSAQEIFVVGDPGCLEDQPATVTLLANENPEAQPGAAVSSQLWEALARFDVVHIHQALTAFGCYCMVVARSLGKPIVLTDFGGDCLELMLPHAAIQMASGVLSMSEPAKALVARRFQGPHEVIEAADLNANAGRITAFYGSVLIASRA